MASGPMHGREQLKTKGRFEPFHKIRHLVQARLSFNVGPEERSSIVKRAGYKFYLLVWHIAAIRVPGH